MKGAEYMLASMIGMKPDDLREAVNGVINAIHEANHTMKRIEQKLDKILADDGDLKNGGRTLPTTPDHRERIQL